MVTHTFNPSSLHKNLVVAVHTSNLSPRGNVKAEETALTHSLILRFVEAGLPFWTKVEVRARGWLLCFSEIQVEPQFLSLGFC